MPSASASFIAGLYWIAAALFVDIARFWWLVPFAAAGLPAAFALYIGLALLATNLARQASAAAAARRGSSPLLSRGAWPNGSRGHVFTGLPWNLVGYAWSGGFPGALACCRASPGSGFTGSAF